MQPLDIPTYGEIALLLLPVAVVVAALIVARALRGPTPAPALGVVLGCTCDIHEEAS